MHLVVHKNDLQNLVTVIIYFHHLFSHKIGIIGNILIIQINRIMTLSFISLLIRATFEVETRDNDYMLFMNNFKYLYFTIYHVITQQLMNISLSYNLTLIVYCNG